MESNDSCDVVASNSLELTTFCLKDSAANPMGIKLQQSWFNINVESASMMIFFFVHSHTRFLIIVYRNYRATSYFCKEKHFFASITQCF
jgi:hypothetical protein